jgi:hypothetical protein
MAALGVVVWTTGLLRPDHMSHRIDYRPIRFFPGDTSRLVGGAAAIPEVSGESPRCWSSRDDRLPSMAPFRTPWVVGRRYGSGDWALPLAASGWTNGNGRPRALDIGVGFLRRLCRRPARGDASEPRPRGNAGRVSVAVSGDRLPRASPVLGDSGGSFRLADARCLCSLSRRERAGVRAMQWSWLPPHPDPLPGGEG